MASNPQLSKSSVDELLISLKDAEDSIPISDPLTAFIHIFKLEQGNFKVNQTIVYKLFSLWTKVKLKRSNFFVKMSRYFEVRSAKYYMMNLSPVEILKLVDKASEIKKRRATKSSIYKQHFDKFLLENDIKSGNHFIESFVIRHIYDKWIFNFNKKKKPLGQSAFLNFCNLYFQKKRLTSDRVSWFGIDKCFIKEGYQEMIDNLRKARKQFHGKSIKKKQN